MHNKTISQCRFSDELEVRARYNKRWHSTGNRPQSAAISYRQITRYHQPSDELSKINWEKITNIIRLGFLNTWEFANSNKYLQKEIK
ncbi:MAG: hypothetical protein IPF54_16970 [Draconibacterium sp.]|nr:hypothetical protein [Draconibacterium sp.]